MKDIEITKSVELIMARHFTNEELEYNNFQVEAKSIMGKMGKEVMMATILPAEYLDTFSTQADFYFPKNSWQMLKWQYRSYLPKWFMERYPVKYNLHSKDVDVVYSAVYPELYKLYPEIKVRYSYNKRT